jgi:hypothetical protein
MMEQGTAMQNEQQAASQMNALEISIERMCASSENGLGPMEAEFNTGIWINTKEAGKSYILYSVFLCQSTGFGYQKQIRFVEFERFEWHFRE